MFNDKKEYAEKEENKSTSEEMQKVTKQVHMLFIDKETSLNYIQCSSLLFIQKSLLLFSKEYMC